MTCDCSETTCCAGRHRALKLSPNAMALNAVYIGVQHDIGFDDMALWNCRRCKSTLAVRIPRQERRAA